MSSKKVPHWMAMWVVFRAVFVIVDIPTTAQGPIINSFAGPYIIYGERFYNCEELEWRWYLKVTHFNPARPYDLQRVTGHINASVYNLTDNAWLRLVMDIRSNNMWKENSLVFNFPRGACSVFREHAPEFFYRLYHQDRNKPKNSPCWIHANNYEVKDEPLPWLFPKFPILPYGRYRVRLTAGNSPLAKANACFAVEINTIPKPT